MSDLACMLVGALLALLCLIARPPGRIAQWQTMGGEAMLSYLTRKLLPAMLDFFSAAGLAVVVILIQGVARRVAMAAGNAGTDPVGRRLPGAWRAIVSKVARGFAAAHLGAMNAPPLKRLMHVLRTPVGEFREDDYVEPFCCHPYPYRRHFRERRPFRSRSGRGWGAIDSCFGWQCRLVWQLSYRPPFR